MTIPSTHTTLLGEVAIVTGASSGIGEAIARRFVAEGAKVAVVGRDETRGAAAVASMAGTGEAAFFRADVTVPEAVQGLVHEVVQRFGDLSIVVNNAGLSVPGTVVDTTPDRWEKVLRLNVTSTYLLSHYAMPHLLARGSGSVINVSSEAGLKGLLERAAYCAAKAAVVGLTKAMAVDHSPHGDRINCICPGTIETPMIAQMMNRSNKPEVLKDAFLQRRLTPFLGTPDDVAEAALYFARPGNRYVTGAVLSIDGGALAR